MKTSQKGDGRLLPVLFALCAVAAAMLAAWCLLALLPDAALPASMLAALVAAVLPTLAHLRFRSRFATLRRDLADVLRRGDFAARIETAGSAAPLGTQVNELLAHVLARDARVARQSREFEATLRARTSELTVARDAADAANRAKSQFLANMSHEIRTPLNGVLGMAELLLKGELSEQQRRYLGVVRSSGKTLLRILNDVLDLSKVESGRLQLETIAYRPRDLFDEVLQLFAPAARNKGLQLAWRLAPALHRQLTGDPHRLKQILSNLLSNAVKFTKAGRVELRAGLVDAGGDGSGTGAHGPRRLVIEVLDTGIGISAKDPDSVFAPFFQSEASHARQFGGTGLGLTIVRELVQLMGGTVSVASRPGEGSRFTVSLPAREPEADAPMTMPALLGGARAWLAVERDFLRIAITEQLDALGIDVLHFDPSLPIGARDDSEALPEFAFVDDGGLASLLAYTVGGPARPVARHRAFFVDTGASPTGASGQSALANSAVRLDAVLTAPWRERDLWQHLSGALDGDAAGDAADAQLQGRVLLVEDNDVNIELSLAMLKMHGIDADVARDGAAALEMLRGQPFDLVLMDVQMPVMDGFEATRRLRELESRQALANPSAPRRWSRLPVVALTGNALKGDRERCLASGFDDYLAKPFSLEAIHGLLRRWLRARTQPAPARG